MALFSRCPQGIWADGISWRSWRLCWQAGPELCSTGHHSSAPASVIEGIFSIIHPDFGEAAG